MADIVGNRTLRSQWDNAVLYNSEQIFLEFVSKEDHVSKFTYSEFDKKVKQAANLFIDLGIEKGEFVAIHVHNSPQYLICWLALAQIGAVSVPLNHHYTMDESSYIIKKCNVRHVIAEPKSISIFASNLELLQLDSLLVTEPSEEWSWIHSLEEINDQPVTLKEDRMFSSEDMAVILFTSGTTSFPKGAIYTHHNVVYGGLLHAAQIGMNEGDRFLTCMPCCHMDFQEMAVMPVICAGGTLIMLERYSVHRFWRQICKYKANFTDIMSFINRTMLMQQVLPWEKDHCLKQVYFSMGLSDEEKENFETRFGVRLLNSYGMTETVSAVTCTPLFGDDNWPSVGRPALSYEIKIIDSIGNEVPHNTIGEICVFGIPGKTIVSGYYNDLEATAQLIDSDGWLHSGDKGYMDADGWLFFVDRSSNIIKRSGENISSSEVENVLTSHSEIEDAAVIGIPDALRGSAVKAYIQTKSQKITAEDVIMYCERRLAKFKIPTTIEFVREFPRTATGKIKKQDLN